MPTPDAHVSLAELLLAFRRRISESAKKDDFKEELTFSQMETLMFIGLSGKKNMENIASYLKITPPSATSMIAKMEKKGLVKRTKDPDDRRIVHIELTPSTKKKVLKLWKHKEDVLETIVSRLSAEDRKHLERIIGILITP